MKSKIKLITAFVLGILVTSVTVYAITVKSSNVTFTPEDNEWDVQDVEAALNDLNSEVSQIKGEAVERVPIYDKGTYYYDFTKYNVRGTGTVTDNTNSIYISTASANNVVFAYTTKIDLTDIDAIYGHLVSANEGYTISICISDYPGCYNSDVSIAPKKGITLKPSNSTSASNYYTDLVNVKELTGEHYIGLLVKTAFNSNNVPSNGYVDGIYMLKKVFQD